MCIKIMKISPPFPSSLFPLPASLYPASLYPASLFPSSSFSSSLYFSSLPLSLLPLLVKRTEDSEVSGYLKLNVSSLMDGEKTGDASYHEQYLKLHEVCVTYDSDVIMMSL